MSNMIIKIVSASEEETLQISKRLGRDALAGDIFTLIGDLGAGKTIIAKGIALGLDIKEDITSPTFNLMEEYSGRLNFFHFDLYRIETDDEFDQLNFEDYWYGNGISVIEWPEKAGARIPTNKSIQIKIGYIGDNRRSIIIEYPDN